MPVYIESECPLNKVSELYFISIGCPLCIQNNNYNPPGGALVGVRGTASFGWQEQASGPMRSQRTEYLPVPAQ